MSTLSTVSTVTPYAGGEYPKTWTGSEFVDLQPDASGPVYTLTCPDYWQWQGCIASDVTDAERVRRMLQAGLLAIDGSTQAAERFIHSPRPNLVNPLVQAIAELALGN
jgi:hypothetical protein